MGAWSQLLEFLVLLGIAFILGTLAEQFKQSAIIGYLIAGALLGPLMFQADVVMGIAELGVALLLFSIGLEFSFRRLRSLGAVAVGGGTIQILTTLVVFAVVIASFRPAKESIVIGAMVALSSTAVVLRVLSERAELDSTHGRNSVGILLIQDIYIVPLILLVEMLSTGGTANKIAVHIGKTLVASIGLVTVFYLLFNFLVPRLLLTEGVRRNRELIHLLTLVSAVGSAWMAHSVGLSPALGAFLAGVLLAGSPFATQIRADIGPIHTVFVTLFFTSIGMLVNPKWILQHFLLIIVGLTAVILGKTILIYAVVRLFRYNRRDSLATGLSLAQIGELSFVLAITASNSRLIGSETFALISSVIVISLFLTPYMTSYARPISGRVINLLFGRRDLVLQTGVAEPSSQRERVLIVGFGPAGRKVAEDLIERGIRPAVLEQSSLTADIARGMGLKTYIGDGTQGEILDRVGVSSARIVVVTVPDTRTSRAIVECVRSLAPNAILIVRARYHILRWELEQAGATAIVDEETEVGRRLSSEVIAILNSSSSNEG